MTAPMIDSGSLVVVAIVVIIVGIYMAIVHRFIRSSERQETETIPPRPQQRTETSSSK